VAPTLFFYGVREKSGVLAGKVKSNAPTGITARVSARISSAHGLHIRKSPRLYPRRQIAGHGRDGLLSGGVLETKEQEAKQEWPVSARYA